MKEILSLLILPVLGCGLISAAQSPDVTVKKDGDMIVKEYKMDGKTIRNAHKMIKKQVPTRSDGEALCALTVELLQGDVEGIMEKDVAVVSRESGEIYGWPMDEEEWEPIEGPIMVPPGAYDIIGIFKGWFISNIYIFSDGVEVKDDTTITLNAADADKEMTFKPLRPNGDGMTVAPTPKDGTSCRTSIRYDINGIYPTTQNAYSIHWSGTDYWADPEEEIEEPEEDVIGGFLTNGTKSFFIGWSASSLDYEYGNVCIANTGLMEKENEVQNSINDFKSFDVDFVPAINQYDDGEFVEPRPLMRFVLYWHDKWIWMENMGASGFNWNWKKNYICNVPEADYVIGIMPIENAISEGWNSYEIQSPAVMPQGDRLVVSSVHPGDGVISIFDYNNSDGEIYIFNPIACYDLPNPLVLGGTVPVTTLLQSVYDMSYYFYGRLGELRTIDYPVSEICAKRNGEIMAESYNDFINMWWDEENIISGDWDITIHNSNLEIDGLRGVNDFSAHFENNNNFWSPAVSGLWFEDGAGLRKESFAHGADGKMVLYAGDFLYNEVEGEVWWDVKQWFECEKPENIAVEYAPYDSENYLPFNLKNDAQKDFMPGWGIYYEADLSDVETVSETGWYTLKISISDAHGNSSVQTVAPAFKLEDKTGIDMVEGVAAENDPIYYDLTGMRIDEPKKGNIYIIRNGSKITKAIK